jgi:hypothetical protein
MAFLFGAELVSTACTQCQPGIPKGGKAKGSLQGLLFNLSVIFDIWKPIRGKTG